MEPLYSENVWGSLIQKVGKSAIKGCNIKSCSFSSTYPLLTCHCVNVLCNVYVKKKLKVNVISMDFIHLCMLKGAVLALNTNTSAFARYAELLKSHTSYFVMCTCVCVLFLLE